MYIKFNNTLPTFCDLLVSGYPLKTLASKGWGAVKQIVTFDNMQNNSQNQKTVQTAQFYVFSFHFFYIYLFYYTQGTLGNGKNQLFLPHGIYWAILHLNLQLKMS